MSKSADDRLAAAAIAATVGPKGAADHGETLARMATTDPDDRARAAALAALIAL